MKHIAIGLFITLILFNLASHAGIITICDLDGNCRQILTPEPYRSPPSGFSPSSVIIDTGELICLM